MLTNEQLKALAAKHPPDASWWEEDWDTYLTPNEIKLYGSRLIDDARCKTSITHKYCSLCNTWKKHRHFYKDKQARCGLHPCCKSCKNIKERKAAMFRKYGLTPEGYNELLEQQDGKCAICNRQDPGSKRLSFFPVDHDHETGKVRGLLCHHCNTALGGFQDDPKLLVKAAQYLMERN